MQLGPGDDAVLRWLHPLLYRWPAFDALVQWLSNASVFKFGPFVLLICWFWFRPGPRLAEHRRLLLDAVFSGLAALAIGRFLALLLPFRERPISRLDLGLVYPDASNLRTWSALPSDHAVIAFALVFSLWRISPVAGALTALHATLLVCLPRLYLGLHHLSDLVVGAAVGIAIAYAVERLDRRFATSAPLLRLESTRPAWFYTAGFFVLFEVAEMFQSFRQLALPLFRALRELAA